MDKDFSNASGKLQGNKYTTYGTMKTPQPTKISINGIEYNIEDLKDIIRKVLEIKKGEEVKINDFSVNSEFVVEELVHTLVKLGDRKIDLKRNEHVIELAEILGFLMWYDLEFLANEVFLTVNENLDQIAIPEHAEAVKELLEILEINTYLNPANYQNFKDEGFETIENAMNTDLALMVVDRWRHGTREERSTIYQFIHYNFYRESEYSLRESVVKTFFEFEFGDEE